MLLLSDFCHLSTPATGLPRRQGLDFQKDMRTSEEDVPGGCQTVSSFFRFLLDDRC
jgi:hypothetical protein